MGNHFVLIHGAWHGGWCWDGVIQALGKGGHTAVAPTMPGHGPDEDRSGIVLDSYVAMAQGLGEHDFIEVDGGHETLFTNPAVVAHGLIQAAS